MNAATVWQKGENVQRERDIHERNLGKQCIKIPNQVFFKFNL